jgi:phosphoribosylformylglycinamidine synthase
VNVRIGKRIELHFDRPITQADLDNAGRVADSFLSNDVIEDVVAITKED